MAEPDKLQNPQKPSRRFPKRERLRTGYEFRTLREKGRRHSGRDFVLYVLEANGEAQDREAELPSDKRRVLMTAPRVGVSVGRRIGNAVTRNRVKRLLREAWRLNKHKLRTNLHVMIVARTALRDRSHQEIEREMLRLLRAADATVPRMRE